jgi:iron-sulfur cluster assembly protein
METSASAATTESPVAAPSEAPKSRREITISDKAVAFAKKKLAARGTPDAAVRLGVKGGGCSGFSYVIQYEDTPPHERDTVYDADGVRFYVDKKSFVYLAGSVLDYEQTLMFQGFKFKNPQEASSCGCGHSFTVR